MSNPAPAWDPGQRPKTPRDAAHFMELMMAELNLRFFAGGKRSDEEWWQSQQALKLQVLSIAEDMDRRGVSLSLERQAVILRTVMATIQEHGSPKGRFVVYFATCLKSHLRIHGARYYHEGKAARDAAERSKVGDLALSEVARMARKSAGDSEALLQARKAIAAGMQKPGKKRKGDRAGDSDLQSELFPN